MRILQKILFPTDFGASAEHAIGTVVKLASTFNSQLILLHVIPGFAEDLPVPMEQAREASARHLDRLKSRLEKQGVVVGAEIVTNGSLFDQIAHFAYEQDVNVIVIGSGGTAGDEHGHRTGTTVERVIRKATRPVWVVREAVTALEKILCPVDFSPASERALKNAIHLSRAFGAELFVLNVVKHLAGFALYGLTEREREHALGQQEETFQEFLKDFDLHSVNWSKSIREGKPHREIIACAKEWPADLLVMGSVGRTGLSKILLGSVAARVLKEMPCSVVTVKTEDVIRQQFEEDLRDIKSSFAEGMRLLGEGQPQQAKRCFHRCVAVDPMFAPGWEGLAEANKRLGNEYECVESRETAQLIRRQLWEKQVDLEIRLRKGRRRDG